MSAAACGRGGLSREDRDVLWGVEARGEVRVRSSWTGRTVSWHELGQRVADRYGVKGWAKLREGEGRLRAPTTTGPGALAARRILVEAWAEWGGGEVALDLREGLDVRGGAERLASEELFALRDLLRAKGQGGVVLVAEEDVPAIVMALCH